MSVFSQRHSLWFAVALTLVTVTPFGQAADPPLHPTPLPILVRGKVLELEPQLFRSIPVRVEVTHVHSGDPKLLGKTFSDSYMTEFGGGYSGGAVNFWPFKVGEVGVWTLTETNFRDQGKQYAVVRRFAPSQTFTKEPASMKLPFEWADAVEKYAKAAPKERGEMLPKLLRSPNTLTAHWTGWWSDSARRTPRSRASSWINCSRTNSSRTSP